MKKYTKAVLAAITLLLIFVGAGLWFYTYRGVYLGAEDSPNSEYSLRYYSSFNPFRMLWSMPGDSACTPRWVRLYDKSENKLKELYTTSCELEMPANWLDKQVVLPDGKTVWGLPKPAK